MLEMYSKKKFIKKQDKTKKVAIKYRKKQKKNEQTTTNIHNKTIDDAK